jgi:exopolysaccharide biosynthesis protein
MDNEGNAILEYTRGVSIIGGLNPRSAIGYYEPGHYCFVTVDGRKEGYSIGMTVPELAQLFEDLGCQSAYNLDGGQTAVMMFGDSIANQPYHGGRKTSDIIYITEPDEE